MRVAASAVVVFLVSGFVPVWGDDGGVPQAEGGGSSKVAAHPGEVVSFPAGHATFGVVEGVGTAFQLTDLGQWGVRCEQQPSKQLRLEAFSPQSPGEMLAAASFDEIDDWYLDGENVVLRQEDQLIVLRLPGLKREDTLAFKDRAQQRRSDDPIKLSMAVATPAGYGSLGRPGSRNGLQMLYDSRPFMMSSGWCSEGTVYDSDGYDIWSVQRLASLEIPDALRTEIAAALAGQLTRGATGQRQDRSTKAEFVTVRFQQPPIDAEFRIARKKRDGVGAEEVLEVTFALQSTLGIFPKPADIASISFPSVLLPEAPLQVTDVRVQGRTACLTYAGVGYWIRLDELDTRRAGVPENLPFKLRQPTFLAKELLAGPEYRLVDGSPAEDVSTRLLSFRSGSEIQSLDQEAIEFCRHFLVQDAPMERVRKRLAEYRKFAAEEYEHLVGRPAEGIPVPLYAHAQIAWRNGSIGSRSFYFVVWHEVDAEMLATHLATPPAPVSHAEQARAEHRIAVTWLRRFRLTTVAAAGIGGLIALVVGVIYAMAAKPTPLTRPRAPTGSSGQAPLGVAVPATKAADENPFCW